MVNVVFADINHMKHADEKTKNVWSHLSRFADGVGMFYSAFHAKVELNWNAFNFSFMGFTLPLAVGGKNKKLNCTQETAYGRHRETRANAKVSKSLDCLSVRVVVAIAANPLKLIRMCVNVWMPTNTTTPRVFSSSFPFSLNSIPCPLFNLLIFTRSW